MSTETPDVDELGRPPWQAERERAELAAAVAQDEQPLRRTTLLPVIGRIELHRERWRAMQRDVCPSCLDKDSMVAQSCGMRGSGPDREGGAPVCRWHADVERDDAAAAELAARRERLSWAGYDDPHVMDLIATATEPPRPRHRRQVTAEFTAMWAAVQQFLRERERLCLTLWGSPGCGKSIASAWIIAAVRGSRLLRPRAEMVPTDDWKQPRVAALNTPLLVIEDLGLEHRSDWHIGEVEGLISVRADAGRRTVVSTNLVPGDLRDPDTLYGRYGHRVRSRLASDTRGSLVVFCGRDDLRSLVPATTERR